MIYCLECIYSFVVCVFLLCCCSFCCPLPPSLLWPPHFSQKEGEGGDEEVGVVEVMCLPASGCDWELYTPELLYRHRPLEAPVSPRKCALEKQRQEEDGSFFCSELQNIFSKNTDFSFFPPFFHIHYKKYINKIYKLPAAAFACFRQHKEWFGVDVQNYQYLALFYYS